MSWVYAEEYVMKKTKRTGPRTDPCWTPRITRSGFDLPEFVKTDM